MRNRIFQVLGLAGLVVLGGACSTSLKDGGQAPYYVAAYIWPSCHNDPRGRDLLWPDGEGEWEVIKKGTPRFEGHYQPKLPLRGYGADNDPKVMEGWISDALSHGVNTFIFDWYWFDGAPFLEACIDEGFLGSRNNKKMNFYLMWANHDVKKNYWNYHLHGDDDSLLWEGAVSIEDFRKIVSRVIDLYFSRPNYLCFDGKPVFSIYDIDNLIKTFGSLEATREGMKYFEEETKKAGFPGLHLQLVTNRRPDETLIDKIRTIGFNSLTAYNWSGPHYEDYLRWGTGGWANFDKWEGRIDIPRFPSTSVGWDDTPRFPEKGIHDAVHYNKSPEAFASFMQRAKDYLDTHPGQPKLITIYAWNEWVEDAYLLPDMKYGYSYLDAVKRVIVDGDYSVRGL